MPPNISRSDKLNEENAKASSEQFIDNISEYPDIYKGTGIVICAGGTTYLVNAWVCVNMLRHLGCSLPIQIWHRGPKELDENIKSHFRSLDVECIDALQVRKQHPARILNGWEIKPYSILHSSFKDVLLLDADNMPVVNPEFLFETPEFREAGAIFWPDYGKLAVTRKIWKICGIPYQNEPEFESGQIVVNKEMCWAPLNLTMWYNEHSDFYFSHIHGDKETFHMAFRKLNKIYAMPKRAIHSLGGVMCQHDFAGRRIFQHRNMAKWKLHTTNSRIFNFLYEAECNGYIDQLKKIWDGRLNGIQRFTKSNKSEEGMAAAEQIINGLFDYNRRS